MKEKISPYAVGSATCSCMKQPKPERFVVTLGMPITVHSAAREWTKEELQTLSQPPRSRGGEKALFLSSRLLFPAQHDIDPLSALVTQVSLQAFHKVLLTSSLSERRRN